MPILPSVSGGEMKAFGIGAGVGAVAGSAITGVIAHKIAKWRIRVKEEETLRSSYGIKEDQLMVTFGNEAHNFIDLFNKRITDDVLKGFASFDPSIAQAFESEVKEKCLPQKSERDPSIYNIHPIALTSIIGPHQQAGTLQTLNEILTTYMSEKGFQCDQYTAIAVSTCNIAFTMIKYIMELRKIPGDEAREKIEALEKSVDLMFDNMLKGALVEGRDSKAFTWLRQKFQSYGYDVLGTKRGGLVEIIREQMKEVFREAYADQERITATLISENVTLAVEGEFDAASEFILRATVAQAAQLPRGHITRSKLAANIAQYQLKGVHTPYNQGEGFVNLVEEHARHAALLHAQIDPANKDSVAEDPSAHFDRLMNLGGNQHFSRLWRRDMDLPIDAGRLQGVVAFEYALDSAKQINLYLKYLNIAAALQADLTRRLDRYGWEGLRKSGEFAYRMNLVNAFKERANEILEKELMSENRYFRLFLEESKSLNLPTAKAVFGEDVTSENLSVKPEAIICGVQGNSLPPFVTLATVAGQRQIYKENNDELSKLSVEGDKKQVVYNPTDLDQLMLVNLSLLVQDDPALIEKFREKEIAVYSASVNGLQDKVKEYNVQFSFNLLYRDYIKSNDKTVDINDLFVNYGNKKIKLRELIENINYNSQFSRYFICDDSGMFKLRQPVYFANVRELNAYNNVLTQFIGVLGTVSKENGKVDNDCRALLDSAFVTELNDIVNITQGLLNKTSPEKIRALEEEEKSQQILLLQAVIVKMNEDFIAMLDAQFTKVEELAQQNMAQLGESIASHYQQEVAKKREEMLATQKRLLEEMRSGLEDKQRSHDSQVKFMQELSAKVTSGYSEQSAVATDLFTRISTQLGDIISSNTARMRELEATLATAGEQKEAIEKLQRETSASLKLLEANHAELTKTHQELAGALASGEALQNSLVEFVTDLINSNKVSELSQKIQSLSGDIAQLSQTPETKSKSYTVIQEDLRALRGVAEYFNGMLVKAEELLNKHQADKSFEKINKAVQDQKEILAKNSEVIATLIGQVSQLQSQLAASHEREIGFLRTEIDQIRKTNEKLEAAQAELAKSKDALIQDKDKKIAELTQSIEQKESALIADRNRALQASYDRFYEDIKSRVDRFVQRQGDYLHKYEAFAKLASINMDDNPYKRQDFSLPDNVRNITADNYAVHQRILEDLLGRVDDASARLDKEDNDLIHANAVYHTKAEYEKRLAAQKAEAERVLGAQQAEAKQQLDSAVAEEKRRQSMEQQQSKNSFIDKYKPLYDIVLKFRYDFLDERMRKGGAKHFKLAQLCQKIDSTYQSASDDAEMRRLFVEFCALCMQKESNYRMFGKQTLTGKKFFEYFNHKSQDQNRRAINKALSLDGAQPLIANNPASGRYRYRDFAANVSGMIGGADQALADEFAAKNVTIHRYHRK